GRSCRLPALSPTGNSVTSTAGSSCKPSTYGKNSSSYHEINLVVTEEASSEKGKRRKRIVLPDYAFQQKDESHTDGKESIQTIVKLVHKRPLPYNGNLTIFLEALENEIHTFLRMCVLRGMAIVGPENIYDYLMSCKPTAMDETEYRLWCEKPLGMSANAYLDILQRYSKDSTSLQNSLQEFMQSQIDKLGAFSSAEWTYYSSFHRFKKRIARMDNEMKFWKAIRKKMQANLESHIRRITHTSKHENRLSAGYASLRYGRILNMKRGDTTLRETGFASDMQQLRLATLSQQISTVFGTSKHRKMPSQIQPGQDVYFKKALKDCGREEGKMAGNQRKIDFLQAVVEFSMQRPEPSSLLKNSIPWRCMGLSFHSILWKVFDLYHGITYVCKYRDVSSLSEEQLAVVFSSFKQAENLLKNRYMPLTVAQSLLFSSGGVCRKGNQLIETAHFIPHISVTEYLNQFGAFKGKEGILKAKWILVLLIRLLISLGDLDFIL
ncbi:hypothetical protein IE077_003784, partial [Cardiosporidium cionae]